MIGEPKIDTRSEKHTVGIRTQVPSSEFSRIIPEFLNETFAWLAAKGIPEKGAFMRYYVINMPGLMDVEVGVQVDEPVEGDDRIKPGIIPAGKYASLIYTGLDGYPGNKALIEWAEGQGLQWDRWDDPAGDAFRSRVEYYLTGPDENPDPDQWENEVAIKLAD